MGQLDRLDLEDLLGQLGRLNLEDLAPPFRLSHLVVLVALESLLLPSHLAVRTGLAHRLLRPPQAKRRTRRKPSPTVFTLTKWAELYSKRVDEMIAVLKTKGIPVLRVGLPAISGTNATGEMSYLDELYRARAEKAGITYINIWDGFVDDQGRYAVQGPDFEGQIRRLRSGDGVHFTNAGALKLAHYAEHDLRRPARTGSCRDTWRLRGGENPER